MADFSQEHLIWKILMRQLHEVAEEIRLNEAARVEESKKSEAMGS